MDATIALKALCKVGAVATNGKKHRKFRLVIDGVFIGGTTLPHHIGKEISGDHANQLSTAIGADSATELRALGACHRSREEHIEKIRAAGKLG